MNISPFAPGATVSLSVSTTSANVALSGTGANVEVQNAGSSAMFVRFGSDNTVTATTSDYPVLAGQSKIISRAQGTQTYFAAVTASGTATAYLTTGEGL